MFTGSVVKAHQFLIPWAVAFIAVSELPDILLLQSGKVPVQLGIEILPVAFPQSQAHVKAEDSLHTGIDALLHVSQISREHVAKPADVLTIGQEITAKIVDFNEEGKKISLSVKAMEAPAAPAEEAPVEE